MSATSWLTVRVRAAVPEDATAICDVLRESIACCCNADHHGDPVVVSRWLANKTVENVKQWIAASDAVALVASRGDDMLGVALLTCHKLALCYVVPRALHQGAGKALLQSVEIAASARGIQVLTLDSTKTAFPFYARNGFTPCGPVRRLAGLEAQPMSKKLVASGSPNPSPGKPSIDTTPR
jgi:GNAT superfamily N-acetyltransferase